MRITKIEIKNFKAFRGPDEIDLGENGNNLLLYGENGSGKTSLYEALKFFLESSENDSIEFKNFQNIFTVDNGYIRLHFTPDPKLQKETYEWSSANPDDAKVQPIIDASKAKGFLDYKDLLKTNFLHYKYDNVNIFDLLIETLLKNIINDISQPPRSFAEIWQDISDLPFSERSAAQEIEISQQLDDFKTGINNTLARLKTDANQILRKFGYENTIVEIDFEYKELESNSNSITLDMPRILLQVKYFERDRLAHHQFLNEAKLSAIALSIFLAGFQLQPPSDLKILVFDDALIGLDMANRLPLLKILKEDFSNYQIFLMTYDKAWYEIVKQQTNKKEWEYAEFGLSQIDEYEMPVYIKNKAYLDKAEEHLNANDYKACAIYLRTTFETILRKYCDKKDLHVRYCEDPKKLKTEDFWVKIKGETKQDKTYPDHKILKLDLTLVDDIELYRRIILNPLSHATIMNISRKEIKKAIEAVKRLKSELDRHLKDSKGQ